MKHSDNLNPRRVLACLIALLAISTLLTASPAAAQTQLQTEVFVEVEDDAVSVKMRSTDGRCLYYLMTVHDVAAGGKPTADKRAKHCHLEVTWRVDATHDRHHRIFVFAGLSKRRYDPIKVVEVLPGTGLHPSSSGPSHVIGLTGAIEINDDAVRGDRGGYRNFAINQGLIVGPNVSVKTRIQRCIGGDTGVRFDVEAGMVGSRVEIDGAWQFSATNRRWFETCHGYVRGRGTFEGRLGVGEQLNNIGGWDRHAGNWFSANLRATNLR